MTFSPDSDIIKLSSNIIRLKGGYDLHNRIKLLRKELNLTQEKFGEKLGMKKNSISQIENGVNALTEQLLVSICREFNVSESWLRTGEGEMFSEVPAEDEYFKAVTQISKSNDKLAMQAIIEYWKLDDVSKEALKNYIYKIAEKSRE